MPGLERSRPLSAADVRYRQPATAIAVPRSILPLPLDGNQRLDAPQQGASLARYRLSAPADSLTGSLRQLIDTWLPRGYPRIEVAAEVAGVHVRALQRQLARDGRTYSELVEQTRFQNAARLLEDTEAKVMDIALELGYGDCANFTHAFRRWAGVSPRAYRRQRCGV